MDSHTKTEILDTTLREGEQCYGVLFPLHVKKEIALLLNETGVDFIEAGHPAAAPSIREAVSEIAQLKLRSRVLAHARMEKAEIRLVKDLGLDWVGLFCGINQRSLDKYKSSKKMLYERAADAVNYAKDLGLSVKFACEDASRTGIQDLIEFYLFLISLGVDRISYADTLGVLRPEDVDKLSCRINGHVPFSALHFHFHNDFGFANDNAIKAIEHGARCVDVSILGIGERMGLVSLERVLAFLRGTGGSKYNSAPAMQASNLVGSCINHEHFQFRRFAHKSGIHINGVIKDSGNYEPVDPQYTGNRRIIVLSKLIGKSGLRMLLSQHGFKHDERKVQLLLDQIKADDTLELADAGEMTRYFSARGLEQQAV